MDSTIGADSQDSDDLVPPGISASEFDAAKIKMPTKNLVCTTSSSPGTSRVSIKGIENAKKRLRAFSIQKKTPITPLSIPKPLNTGSATVLIGKLTSMKPASTPKPDLDGDQKKPPKPPKPGKNNNIGYCTLRKRTLTEIEDMKRKMELIELGIPLGLICPTSSSEKAMPTKAMPPIKTFLDPSKVDELIREAKKAKAEGKEFKFDYHKILPDYDNPFQRKKDEYFEKEKKDDEDHTSKSDTKEEKEDKKVFRKPDRRYSDRYDRNDKYKTDRNKYREKVTRIDTTKVVKDAKEAEVNLHDYLVCDSWSLDNEDKIASPGIDLAKVDRNTKHLTKEHAEDDTPKSSDYSSKPTKIEKLQPVIDSFRYEIDPNEDEALDIFDEDCEVERYAKKQPVRDMYDSPIDLKLFEYDQDMSKDGVIDANDDNFLESVINEIKQENMSDDTSQDKGLVEYDSPKDDDDDYDSKVDTSQGSVTPELDDRMRDLQTSQQSHYSDGYRSTDSYKSVESGYKSTESGYKCMDADYKSPEAYKSTEKYKSADNSYKAIQSEYQDEPDYKTAGYKSTGSGYKSSKGSYKSPDRDYRSKDGKRRSESRQSESRSSDGYASSVDKDLDVALLPKMAKSTVDSLETWSFVLKICQPLLFRHDKNKCYKETHTTPKLWYTVNPKRCSCVKDRSVVYEELEMCKMSLVDRVYGCDQIPEGPCPPARAWYPRLTGCMTSVQAPQPATDWETDDPPPRSTTPQPDEICIDREYQRFMKAVWPDVAEAQQTSRSTTPIQDETRKKKKLEDTEKEADDKKKSKKMKLSSEGWSQESDIEEDTNKQKKIKSEKVKNRKRKRSVSISSSSDSDSEEHAKAKKKIKKKEDKKTKAKLAKRRRVSKKVKKLKDKQKKKKNNLKIEKIKQESEEEKELKKEKKIKKKKLLKLKKAQKKKKSKAKSSSSSSSTTSSSSESESELDKKKKIKKKELEARKKKKDKKKKKRKTSTDSTQSEDLFDVNVLNNIKTERLTDDEKNQEMNDFSPRRHKPRDREIINVKELQNDFVGNNLHIKQEKVEVSVVDEQSVGKEALSEERKVSSEEVHKCGDVVIEHEQEDETSLENAPIEPITSHLPSTIPLPEEIELPDTVPELYIPQPVPEPDIPLPASEPPAAIPLQLIPQPIPQIPVPVQQPVPQIPLPVQQPVSQIPVQQIPKPAPHMPVPVQQPVPQIPVPETPKPVPVPQIPTDVEKLAADKLTAQCYRYTDVSSQHELYDKGIEESEDKFADNFVQEYEMYEHMAMAYQSDLSAVDPSMSGRAGSSAQRIETVVRRRGEIKCDWRAGDSPAAQQQTRPSRWGLKPGEVNIVLTGGPTVEPVPPPEQFPIRSVVEPVYKIQSLATRQDSANAGGAMGYDEAYMDTYGASDLLQYGDCFASEQKQDEAIDEETTKTETKRMSSLDERIDKALRGTILGDVAKDPDDKEAERDIPEKGILITKSLTSDAGRVSKRVSFADGYKPGQDSDVEEPPVKRKKKSRRHGCAWPCPAGHPDHVPLWDALPPPPPPRSPPPPPQAPPPLHLLRAPHRHSLLPHPHHPQHPQHVHKCDPSALPAFMPPEPPPGMISFQ